MKAVLFVLIVLSCLASSACGGGKPASREASDKGSGATPGGEKQSGAASESKNKPEGKENGAESHREGTEAPVELSVAAQHRAKLAVVPVDLKPLAETISLNGTVQPIDGRVGLIQPLARGRVTSVLVRVGDRVQAGQPLAHFDNIEAGELAAQYNAARAELARLKVQLATISRQAERSRNLLAIGAVPAKEVEAVEGERQGQEELIRAQESTLAGLEARLHRFGLSAPSLAASLGTTIQAPFSGVITAVQAAPGAVVDPTSQLFAIADLSKVYVAGQVYEKDLSRVFVGQAAHVLVAAYPDISFSGRVASIGTTLDPTTRTAPVRCEVANAGGRLRLDMFATVELPTPTRREVLAVPVAAVQRINDQSTVFVRQDATHFAARPIQLGRTVGGWVEIVSGLTRGEPIVTQGAFQVKSALLGSSLGEEEEK